MWDVCVPLLTITTPLEKKKKRDATSMKSIQTRVLIIFIVNVNTIFPLSIQTSAAFRPQAVLCSGRISVDAEMNDTSSKWSVSSAGGKDESVTSHLEDWRDVISMRWLSVETKCVRVISRTVISSCSLLCYTDRRSRFSVFGAKISVGIAPWRMQWAHASLYMWTLTHILTNA